MSEKNEEKKRKKERKNEMKIYFFFLSKDIILIRFIKRTQKSISPVNIK